MKTYIVGHKSPDSDAIISTIVFAEFLGNGTIAARTGEVNKEAAYALKRFGFEHPIVLPSEERKIILVDHNSPEEGPDDLKLDEVVAIYDHHKLGGPRTSEQVAVRIERVGCTSTVASIVMKEQNYEPDANLAGLMISAILSDTLKFTSPITTERDRVAVEELNDIARLDIDVLADEMFRAKSDISDISSEELIGKDYKIYQMCGKRVAIGVWETVMPETILERKEEILELLSKRKIDDALDYIYFAAVDILNNKSDFFIIGDEEKVLAEAVFGAVAAAQVLSCPGVVSRKQQMTPPIEKYLAK